jgi:arsenate reductase
MGIEASSAGTQPANRVAEHAITLLHSRGINTSHMRPQHLDEFDPASFDRVISMGCGVHCPAIRIDEDWGLDDPVGQPYEVYESTAEEIERRLNALMRQAS